MPKLITKEWTFVDKTSWGPGPWQDEPDKIQWEDKSTGLPCMIRRSPASGGLCGYVGIPSDHPYHGKSFSDLDDISVHGGLTYSAFCQTTETGAPSELGICHITEEKDQTWWLGFDCGHCFDHSPKFSADLKDFISAEHLISDVGQVYRDMPYVTAETADLAKQLNEATNA